MKNRAIACVFAACILQMAIVLAYKMLHLNHIRLTEDQLRIPAYAPKLAEPRPTTSGEPPTRIPKILHQMFNSLQVFEDYRPLIANCLRLNPDWTYYLWTEEDTAALVREHYPQLRERTRAMNVWLERGDTARYALLHRFGGVYLDMDVDCRKPLFPMLTSYSAFTAQETPLQTQILYNERYRAANGIMGTVPGHPFFQLIIDKIIRMKSNSRTNEDVTAQVGPKLLTLTLQEYWRSPLNATHPIAMLPSFSFIPRMDDMHPWRADCEYRKLIDAAEEKLQYRETLQPNESGCMQLKQRGWSLLDEVQPRTVGIHKWIHLVYRLGFQKRLKRFDIRKHFASRINFYVPKAANSTVA